MVARRMAQPHSNNHDRRKERRRLLKIGRSAAAAGFPADLNDEASVAVTLLLHEKLTETGNPGRAGEAAAIIERIVDLSNAKYERAPSVACKRGCSHCCVTVASATPPEIFRVAAWIRQNRMHSSRMAPAPVIERARLKQAATLDEMFKQKVPCPVIVDHECGAHPSRPITCRQFLSTSLPACLTAFGRGEGTVPFVTEATDRGMLARIVLTAAIKAAGFPDTAYELSGALARALEDEDSERRWLAGEDVFPGVLTTPRPPSTQDVIDRCAGAIAGLMSGCRLTSLPGAAHQPL